MTTSSPTIADNTLTTGLVGYWTFDRAHVVWADTTTEIKDSASTNHGNALGSLAAGSLTVGKQGQALTFNGSSDYVDVPDNSSLDIDTTSLTIAFWMKLSSMPGSGIYGASPYIIFDKAYGGSAYTVFIGNNGMLFNLPSGAGGIGSSFTPVLNQWMHYVAVFDNANDISRVYLDGSLHDTATNQVGNLDQNDYSLRIGYKTYSGTTGTYFNGTLDDVRIYNRALSSSEVYQLYTAGTATVNAPPEDPLSQSLLGYWKLDEGTGTNATDSSGNANTLAMTGSPAWATGNIGPYDLDFSGTAQYLSVADPSSGVLDFADETDFSISGWFNRDTFTADHTIVAKKTDQTTNAGYVVWIDASTDTVNFEISDGTDTYEADSTTAFTATGWHHFVAVWDDSNGAYVYIDGGLNGSTTSSTSSIGDISNANAFRIGAESDAGVPFDGKLDDIRIYGYALSADQVKKVYNTTSPTQPIDTSLVGHWTFDGTDIQGTTAIDRSSYGNNGTITGAVPAIGKLGQALSFNGTSDYVNVGDMNNMIDGISYFTVSVWVNQTTLLTESKKALGKYYNLGTHFDFGTNIGDADDILFRIDYDNYGHTSSNIHSAKIWEHWTAVFDGTQTGNSNRLKVYVNGSQQTLNFEGTTIPATIASSSFPFVIGSNAILGDYGQSWNGSIDDVRIYNRALLASEVMSIYNMGR